MIGVHLNHTPVGDLSSSVLKRRFKKKKAESRASQKIFLICFYQSVSLFQLHRKKTYRPVWYMVAGTSKTDLRFAPEQVNLSHDPTPFSRALYNKEIAIFSSQSTVFLQQQWTWDHSSLTWPFYKALYKPVISWRRHCPWKKERQANIDANMEWLGQKRGTYKKVAYLKAPPQRSGQLFYYMPPPKKVLSEIYKTIFKKKICTQKMCF